MGRQLRETVIDRLLWQLRWLWYHMIKIMTSMMTGDHHHDVRDADDDNYDDDGGRRLPKSNFQKSERSWRSFIPPNTHLPQFTVIMIMMVVMIATDMAESWRTAEWRCLGGQSTAPPCDCGNHQWHHHHQTCETRCQVALGKWKAQSSDVEPFRSW